MKLASIGRQAVRRGLERLGYRILPLKEGPLDWADDAALDSVKLLLFEAAKLTLRDDAARRAVFELAQSFGAHLTPVHFYSPVPDTNAIPETTWSLRYDDLPNLDVQPAKIAALLSELEPFSGELADVPAEPRRSDEYHWNNPAFHGGDASLLYAMVRRSRPRRIIEIGSGFSTLIGLKALSRNGVGSYTCIEPYPSDSIQRLAREGRIELRAARVEELPLELFRSLEPGDILFIDSTHVVRTGSDVVYELLKIVPATKPGVLVHAHDIFFPGEMPRSWVVEKQHFWNEQYLLIALLAFNREFEMLIPNGAFACEGFEGLKESFAKAFPFSPVIGGSSFWFRRRDEAA